MSRNQRITLTVLAVLVAGIVAVAVAMVVTKSDNEGKRADTVVVTATAREQTASCEKVRAPKAKRINKRSAPKFKLDPAKKYVAAVDTNCGSFEIALDAKRAPITGGSFVTLAREGFYDGLTFHRIVPGFVIQGGDPSGNGSGGPGYSVRERPPSDVAYTEGVVAMAKTGAEPPGTSGSQFYVVTGTDAGLPPDYALLGDVTKGISVTHEIESVDVNGETPVDPVVIKEIAVRVS